MNQLKNNLTREQAVGLIDSIIKKQSVNETDLHLLNNISSCIKAEMFGRHVWSIPVEDASLLHSDLPDVSQSDLKKLKMIEKSVRFIPSEKETPEIKRFIQNMHKDFFGEKCLDETVEDIINNRRE